MANNNNIEKSATISVEAVLNDTGYVEPYINTGDKEPIWDGCVYVYNDKEKHNNDKNYQFRIPVQVKGTLAKIEHTLQYGVSVSNLKHYLRDGGVLYFVVQVDLKCHNNNKIFYCNLDPFHIKKYLSTKNKSKVNVTIKPFPKECLEIVNVLYDFDMHLQKQKAYCLLANEQTNEEINAKKIVIPFVASFNNIDIERRLLNLDSICYFEKDGMEYPYEEVKPGDIYSIKNFNDNISVNGTTYFNQYKIQRSKYSVQLIIDNAITLTFKEKEDAQYSYETKGLISQCVHNLTFFLESMKCNGFLLGNNKLTLDFAQKDIEELEGKLGLLIKLQKALSFCNLAKELQLKNLVDTDYQNIEILIKTLLEHKELGMNVPSDTESFLFNIVICNQRIICIATKSNNNKYKIHPFSPNFPASGERDGKKYQISPYALLKSYNLINLINVDFSRVLDNIKQFDFNECYISWLNNFVLQLILAYDESKEGVLLQTAKEIISLVIEKNTDKKSEIPYKLNLLQCKYREKTPFSEDDLEFLHNVCETDNEDVCKYGAYVLLKDKYASKYFEKLEPDIQKNIVGMPIYNLWKDLNNG